MSEQRESATLPHPTAVQTSLFSYALFAKFSPSGRYVADGRADGSAAVWDLETRAPVRTLEGHIKGVTSLDWSRNSRYLLTSSKDWNVIVWDLSSEIIPPQRYRTISFDTSVVSAQFHPRNSKIVLALLSSGEAHLVDLRPQHRARIELEEVAEDVDDENYRRPAMTCARFDPSGKHIFVGTSASTLFVFNTRTKTMVGRHKINGAGTIKGIEFDKSARRMVTNSSDRTLRHFMLPVYPVPSETGDYLEHELEPIHRFNDPINRTAWQAMSYSPNGEWLAGGASDAATHKIYIWDLINDGRFATTLEGAREPLTHVHWHPSKSSIASTTSQGNILIWHCPIPERWGAFAGGFEEVDTNIEYEEREDEFDIEDEEEVLKRRLKQEEEEVDIDTVSENQKTVPSHDPWSEQPNGTSNVNGIGGDVDRVWADDDPDDDTVDCALKVIIEGQEEY